MIIDSHLHLSTETAERHYFPPRQWHVGLKNLVDWWKSLPETGKKYGCDFTVEEVDLMLGGNAERLLGLEKRPEWEREHKYGWTYRYPSPNHG